MSIYGRVFPMLLLSLVFAGPGISAAPVREAEPDPLPLTNTANGAASVSDFWRAVRSGKTGYVADPTSQSGLLITDWPKDCVEAGNCTERAVGFTLPIHDLMPVIREPEGQGVQWRTVLFALGLFVALLISGALFVRKLGAER